MKKYVSILLIILLISNNFAYSEVSYDREIERIISEEVNIHGIELEKLIYDENTYSLGNLTMEIDKNKVFINGVLVAESILLENIESQSAISNQTKGTWAFSSSPGFGNTSDYEYYSRSSHDLSLSTLLGAISNSALTSILFSVMKLGSSASAISNLILTGVGSYASIYINKNKMFYKTTLYKHYQLPQFYYCTVYDYFYDSDFLVPVRGADGNKIVYAYWA